MLLHDITRLASPFDPGGLAPSFGLDIVKAERIFQSAGCYPITVYKEKWARKPVLQSTISLSRVRISIICGNG